MRSGCRTRRAAIFMLGSVFCALIACAGLFLSSKVIADRSLERAIIEDKDRLTRHAQLRARLESASRDEFLTALDALAKLDEPGALDVWKTALYSSNPELKKEAWRRYAAVRGELTRKELVPQVAQVAAPQSEITELARSLGIEINVWSESETGTVIAAPAYFLERLESSRVKFKPLYSTIADWQQAVKNGDEAARRITPGYQSDRAAAETQVRIAIVDLTKRERPATGYSDWLGDRENILMRNDSFLAYLDLFTSDGSSESISAHVQEQYTRRGYRLAAFYTAEQFSERVERFFPGKTFSAGPRALPEAASGNRAASLEGAFHSYDETMAEFKSLAGARPNLAQFVEIGRSHEGRVIFALKISKDVSVNDPRKPEVLITGAHHAREWISVETPIYFAKQFLNNYDTDDSVRHMVDSLQIWIVPIVNPDGLVFSQNAPNSATDGVRLWRKNRRPVSNDCGSDTGVDLNRNYDFQWRLESDAPCETRDDDGASDSVKSEVYRGPKAASEPEVQALTSLTDDPNRRFRVQLDYHNFSQLILYPWGYQEGIAPDSSVLSDLAQRMSDRIFAHQSHRYTPQQAIDLYKTTGTSTDYAYGVNRVAAPFVIEMRPSCCDFSVPESEIGAVNHENWLGARLMLNWATGPAILESVQAYQLAVGGGFTKLVYSARWTESAGSRQMVVDTRFPGIEPGRIQLRLQFSKPMDSTQLPVATLGRNGRLDELRLLPVGQAGGWQKSVYANDTWVGEAVVLQDTADATSWQLQAQAIDPVQLNIDAKPGTIASYQTGTGNWRDYEDADEEGTAGGADTHHILSPTLRADIPNIFLGSPAGGERLPGGAVYTVAWTVPKNLGLSIVRQELLLSTDGGASFEKWVPDLAPHLEKFQIAMPKITTTQARVRVLVQEASVGNVLFGDSQINFTIGSNVGAGVDLSVLSSERLDESWTDTPQEEFGAPSSGAQRLVINLSLTNRSSVAIAHPFLQVADVTRGNVLLTRDSKSGPRGGARQSIDAGSDSILSPGETVQVRLQLGIVIKKKFNLYVDIFGVPVNGSISPADSLRIWKGKPRTL